MTRGSNVEDSDEENYLSAGLLKPSKSLLNDEELEDMDNSEEPSFPPVSTGIQYQFMQNLSDLSDLYFHMVRKEDELGRVV